MRNIQFQENAGDKEPECVHEEINVDDPSWDDMLFIDDVVRKARRIQQAMRRKRTREGKREWRD